LGLLLQILSYLQHRFYIYKNSDPYSDTIILVPTAQFVTFLCKINDELNINLTIPRAAGGAFEIAFEHDGTPCPRYLGRSESSDMADNLKFSVPPSTYKLKGESEKGKPSDQSLEAFRRKVSTSYLARNIIFLKT
jgi:hypothetical protein